MIARTGTVLTSNEPGKFKFGIYVANVQLESSVLYPSKPEAQQAMQDRVDEINRAAIESIAPNDGEVLATDTDGCLICFNADNGQPYNCGETLDQYGEHNLTDRERKRLGTC